MRHKQMSDRDSKIDEEARALWRSLHDEPPPEGCNGVDLLDAVLESLGTADYDRLANPWLRDRNLTWPVTGGARPSVKPH